MFVQVNKMAQITLELIHKDLMDIKKEMEYIKYILEEDFEISEEVISEVQESRKRLKNEFISNEEMKKEFG